MVRRPKHHAVVAACGANEPAAVAAVMAPHEYPKDRPTAAAGRITVRLPRAARYLRAPFGSENVPPMHSHARRRSMQLIVILSFPFAMHMDGTF